MTNNGVANLMNLLIGAPPAKGACASGRIQRAGTCWFQSLINPFLLSDLGRDLLATKLAEFKYSNNVKKWTLANACPRTLSGAFFWSYIEYKLKQNFTNIKEYKKVMRGEMIENKRLIPNIGLKRPNENVTGGVPNRVIKFLNSIFKSDYGIMKLYNCKNMMSEMKTESFRRFTNNAKVTNLLNKKSKPPLVMAVDLIKLQDGFHPVKSFNFNNYTYKLFGASMDGYNSKNNTGHTITGYICEKNKTMIYDSNKFRAAKIDWTTKEFWSSKLKNYLNADSIYGCLYYARVGPVEPWLKISLRLI